MQISLVFVSGRLPFMFIADVTIGGDTKQINLINLQQSQTPSGDAQGKYDMRKFDVEVLKDTLMPQHPTANLILLETTMMMLTLQYQMSYYCFYLCM
jgi:hypothetical protein